MQTAKNLHNSNPEIWGGIECTINRVNDSYNDQLHLANHYKRNGDIELIAELGIKTLRYPILWEYHQPEVDTIIEWSWKEKQLISLQEKNIKPIAGLLHHGSGPAFTNLLDEHFPEKLASYAKQVAEKFNWIEYYTPVNEPLTTARFSGLYGFWYPHIKNDISFARMFLNQIKGIVLSMNEIRKINPNAKLIQTEDLSKTYSTPYLQFQANFENERRWLTFDLLCGKVKPGSVMWNYFSRLGIPEKTLEFFLENICIPDIAGFNYYVTSERFLDENIKKYPAYTHGGNELQVYADIEATRVPHHQPSGLKLLLKEAWERFDLPMAITEAHLNCTREEQVRWFKEIWDTCVEIKSEGADLRAVTAWSLFGAYGWNHLLTSKKMEYEPGVFDLRSGAPKHTALTHLVKELAAGKNYDHPLVKQKGWWKRDIRFTGKILHPKALFNNDGNKNPLLIIGKNGTLGRAFANICEIRGISYQLLDRNDVDITNEQQVKNIIENVQPWAIINAAGFVRVDDAEHEIDKCFADNTVGPFLLADECFKNKISFLTFSSDLVFDGNKTEAYVESDKINPLNVYGKSKADAETLVLQANPKALIIRTSSFFGPWDEYNFITNVLSSISANKIFVAADDVFISPTYVPDLANYSLDLLIDKENNIWHLTNNGQTTWADLAVSVALKAGLNSNLIIARNVHTLNLNATRPKFSVLKTEKGIVLPSLENAIQRFFQERIIKPGKSFDVKSMVDIS